MFKTSRISETHALQPGENNINKIVVNGEYERLLCIIMIRQDFIKVTCGPVVDRPMGIILISMFWAAKMMF